MIKLHFGVHSYSFGEGPDGHESSEKIVKKMLRLRIMPVPAVQAAYDLFGVTESEKGDSLSEGTLNSHEKGAQLTKGYLMEYGEFSMVFPRMTALAKAIGLSPSQGSIMCKTGKPRSTRPYMGLTGRKL